MPALTPRARLRAAGFVGADVADEHEEGNVLSLYIRWFSSGVLDVVTINHAHHAHHASAYRASGLGARCPVDADCAVAQQRATGPVTDVVDAVLALPDPDPEDIALSKYPSNEEKTSQGT